MRDWHGALKRRVGVLGEHLLMWHVGAVGIEFVQGHPIALVIAVAKAVANGAFLVPLRDYQDVAHVHASCG